MNVPLDKFLYFGYGSNMSHARLQSADRAPSAQFVGAASVRGYRLVFDKRGKDGSGKADCWRTGDANDIVHGALFVIDQVHRAALDRVEGKGHGYDDADVDVQSGDGVVSALTYVATNKHPSLMPYGWYLYHVLHGARQCGLPSAYIAAIEGVAVLHDPDLQREEHELSIYPGLKLPRTA